MRGTLTLPAKGLGPSAHPLRSSLPTAKALRRERFDGQCGFPRHDQVGDRSAHQRSEQDALLFGAGRQVGARYTLEWPHDGLAVGGDGSDARGLSDLLQLREGPILVKSASRFKQKISNSRNNEHRHWLRV